MNIKNINSTQNSNIQFNGKNKTDKKLKPPSNVVVDTISIACSFAAYKSIDKFTPVTNLFKNGLGKKTKGLAVGASIVTGMIANPLLSLLYKSAYPKEKNINPKKQILQGAINGISAPLLAISNLFLTIPTTLFINTGSQFLLEKKNEKNFKNYLNKQKEDWATLSFAAVPLLAFLGYKGKVNLKSWQIACQKAKENNQNLKSFVNPYAKKFNLEKITEHLDEKMYSKYTQKLLPIFFKPSEDTLIDTNIFIAKWLQTIPDKKIDELQDLGGMPISPKLKQVIKNLKGACPRSYTLDEAQNIITKTYGNKYTIIQDEPLGVGTIAETYLAKNNNTDTEVVIKFLKKGITKEKIETDKQQALRLLQNSKFKDKPEEYTFYQKYINVMYDAWAKETNLSLEEEAAKIMAKNAKKFNVVKPIEIKDNIYVMEKAKGVQLNRINEELTRRNMTLSEEQIKKLLLNYNEVFIEQLISIPRNGQKIVQADPNSANIFIDLDNLDKPITFLDLGNVLRYDNLTATRNALGHLDFIFGNSRGIAKTNLEGAILPDNLTKEDALDKLTTELDKHIFNKQTKIPPPNTVNDFCIELMKEMKIIPNADNANLIKAETTYFSNILELRHKIRQGLEHNTNSGSDFSSKLKILLQEMKETGDFQTLIRCTLKEIYNSVKRANFKTQKHAFYELKEKIAFIDANKEQALTTFYGLIN